MSRSASSTNSSSRISASGSSPRLQDQHDDFRFQVDRAADGRAVDHHLAHRRRQHASRLEKADEADAVLAQVLVLGGRVHAQALRRLLADIGLRGARQAVEPGQCLLDLIGLEADRRQLARELRVLRTRVRPPVVFVQVDEHVEHAGHYTPAPAAARRDSARMTR
jgi:hypothetical protein